MSDILISPTPSNKRIKNITGQQFGRLTAIQMLEEKTKTGEMRWLCRCECGTEIIRSGGVLRAGRVKSCGCLLREKIRDWRRNNNHLNKGASHPNWKGGKRTSPFGYTQIRQIRNATDDGGYKFEHIIVMEEYLGRKLFPGETIHHKNGVRNDNRLENLELKASNHGQGQTIPDLLNWADELIKRYRV